MMGFFQSIKSGYTRMSDFSGRSDRYEFWFWVLYQWLVKFLCLLLGLYIFFISLDVGYIKLKDYDLDTPVIERSEMMSDGMRQDEDKIIQHQQPFDWREFALAREFSIGLFNSILLALLPLLLWKLIHILPNIAIGVRRLHDVDITGFLMFLHLVPLGGVALFVMHLLPGTEGNNTYGPVVNKIPINPYIKKRHNQSK
tara:strand:+ start:288 stop:881 length:594 start_codon:yes stop_codon:yes gene_type:complete